MVRAASIWTPRRVVVDNTNRPARVAATPAHASGAGGTSPPGRGAVRDGAVPSRPIGGGGMRAGCHSIRYMELYSSTFAGTLNDYPAPTAGRPN